MMMRIYALGARRRTALVALFLAAVFAPAAEIAYRLSVEPEHPRQGEAFEIVIEAEGLSHVELEGCSLGEGLSLEASSVRPRVGLAAARLGVEIRLRLVAALPGARTIASIAVRGAEGRLVLGPVSIEVLDAQGAGTLPAWRWEAPSSCYRYEAFAVRLEGPSEANVIARVGFPAPSGLALERAGSALAWVCTALDDGEFSLPEVEVEAGAFSGRAFPHSIAVKPLPAALATTRAIGEFRLSLEGPRSAVLRVGERASFRLILKGRGNHPALILPPPRYMLDDRPLESEALACSRIDAVLPGPGGYEGETVLEVQVSPPRAGTLRVEAPPFPVLGAAGRIEWLSAPPLTFEVRVLAHEGLGDADPFAAWHETAAAPTASRRAAPAEAGIRDAEAAWRRGERGKALALVCAAARTSPFDARLRTLASSLAAEIGAPTPLADRYPPPVLALGAAAAAASLAAVLIVAGRAFLPLRGGKAQRQGRRPAFEALGGLLLAAALALLALAALASREHKATYAVVWTDRALSIPSPKAEGGTPLVRGETGRVIGHSEGYVALRFPDGTLGWVPEETVYLY